MKRANRSKRLRWRHRVSHRVESRGSGRRRRRPERKDRTHLIATGDCCNCDRFPVGFIIKMKPHMGATAIRGGWNRRVLMRACALLAGALLAPRVAFLVTLELQP